MAAIYAVIALVTGTTGLALAELFVCLSALHALVFALLCANGSVLTAALLVFDK
jgi:hypothetical protein